MHHRLGLPALILAAALWGATVVLIRFASDELGVTTLTVIDAASAAVALLIAVAVSGRRLPRPSARLVAIGALEPGIAYVLINYGIAHTSGSHASLIVGTESMFVIAIIAVRDRVRPAGTILVGVVLATGGTALLAGGDAGVATLRGDVFVLLGIVAAAGYVVLMQPLAGTAGALELTAGQFVYGAFVTIPLTALCSAGGALPSFNWAPTRFILAALAVGVVGSTVAFVIYNWALSRTGAGVSAISLTLIPLFGLAFSIVLLGDDLTARIGAAAVAVIAGVTIISRAEAGVEAETPEPVTS